MVHAPTTELPTDLTAKWAMVLQGRKCEVNVDGNPWVRPPKQVVAQGLDSAERWWRAIERFGEGTSNKLKVVLLGLAGAGKTTVVRYLTGGDPPDKRTIGIELTEWKPREDLPLAVSLWDFAGQSDYYASHQIFLTEGALFILVVDLFKLGKDEMCAGTSDPRGAIFRWLDILHERVPGAVVALVGTHGDHFFPLPSPSSSVSSGDPRRQVEEFMAAYPNWDPDDDDSSSASGREIFDKLMEHEALERRQWSSHPSSDAMAAQDTKDDDDSVHRGDDGHVQLEAAVAWFKSLVCQYQQNKIKEIETERQYQKGKAKDIKIESMRSLRASIAEQKGAEEGVPQRVLATSRTASGSFRGASGAIQRVASQRFFEPLVILHESVFRASRGPDNRIGKLRDWIVDSATEKKAFSFPAVGVIVPSNWVEAIAAVEALGQEKGTPYVMWGDAVDAFQQQFQEEHSEALSAEDAASTLKDAMKHREAEGGVILSLRHDSSPSPKDMIHLDPRWLIDLVRRVVDHNLVDKTSQSKIFEELGNYHDKRGQNNREGYRDLRKAHTSFIRQGRLNREYLRFLWLYRELEDKDDYHPGVQLDDDSFESMLRTMIKYLFIYPAHGESSNVEEVYIVPARLPEYGDEKVLEKSIGLGQVVVGTTALFRRTHVPTGIIGRFLAFSASKIVSSGVCWQHGAHVEWKQGSQVHDVLLCETTVGEDEDFPALSMCVKGQDATAKGVLWEVKSELDSLLQDSVHGYPGLALPTFEDLPITKSDEFQRHLRPYLDLEFKNIAAILGDIRRNAVSMFQAAFPSCCDRNEYPYPRLVLFRPAEDTEVSETHPEEGGNRAIQMRNTWDRWIRRCRSGRCDFDLVFLCERDFSPIPCGLDGKGYRVYDPALFNKLKPLIQGALWLVRIAIGVVSNVDLPLNDLLGAFVNATASELLEATPTAFNPDAKLEPGQPEEFQRLHGPAYKALCDFMRQQESSEGSGSEEPSERPRCCSCLRWLCSSNPAPATQAPAPAAPAPAPCWINWRDHMVQVQNPGTGLWAWVRKDEVEA